MRTGPGEEEEDDIVWILKHPASVFSSRISRKGIQSSRKQRWGRVMTPWFSAILSLDIEPASTICLFFVSPYSGGEHSWEKKRGLTWGRQGWMVSFSTPSGWCVPRGVYKHHHGLWCER